MKELNCHYFDLVIILKSLNPLEFYEQKVNYFNISEAAFEVHEKFGRLHRKTVNTAAQNKGKTTPETFSLVGRYTTKGCENTVRTFES